MFSARSPRHGNRPAVAGYLRCYPYDTWLMDPHRRALEAHARTLGLPEPDIFLDNGCPAAEPLPRLETLLGAVARGAYGVVLIPGPFVLALDDDKARRMIERIRGHGCHVVELPGRRGQAVATWAAIPRVRSRPVPAAAPALEPAGD